MEPKNKHNLFSKEEFFKLIDEKRALPADADDFDKEAMEGLAMVTDRSKLDTLDDSIDEVLRREASKAKRKRTIYFMSAAASLLLIVGLFFLVKETTFEKKDTGIAENTTPSKTEESGAVVAAKEEINKEENEAPKTTVANGEAKGKELAQEAKLEEQISTKGPEKTMDVSTLAAAPTEKANATSMNEKNVQGGMVLPDANGAGGKTGKDIETKEKEKREAGEALAKKAEDKKTYKADKDEQSKVRYETNTVWTGTTTSPNKAVSDQLKQKAEGKPGTGLDDNRNDNTTIASNNAVPAQVSGDVMANDQENDNTKSGAAAPQKSQEAVVRGKSNASKSPAFHKSRKKARKVKASFGDESKQPASETAGYSYYNQTGTRTFTSPEFVGGSQALQKYVNDNLKISVPDKKGVIVAEFTVKADGTIDTASIKITQPVKDCDACSKDVIDLVKGMPQWKPALENGKPQDYLQKLSVQYDVATVRK